MTISPIQNPAYGLLSRPTKPYLLSPRYAAASGQLCRICSNSERLALRTRRVGTPHQTATAYRRSPVIPGQVELELASKILAPMPNTINTHPMLFRTIPTVACVRLCGSSL